MIKEVVIRTVFSSFLKNNVDNPFSVFFLLLTLKKQKKWGQLSMEITWMGSLFVLIYLQAIC